MFEASFRATGSYENPYLQVAAEANFTRPGSAAWKVALFWDGGDRWKLRVSPDVAGQWSFTLASNDPGLNGRSGAFLCMESKRAGGLRPSSRWPGHFERQNGAPFWFMGDTAWAYFTDSAEDNHNRPQAERLPPSAFRLHRCKPISETQR